MAPPSEIDAKRMDQLALWYAQHGALFELGTLYTMVAGLLNIVVILDAYAGPFILNYPASDSRGPPGDVKEKA
jgi:Flp pilus assembly protein protease CpaA